ncbi:uncharacterized protein HGUI_00274 [Hanseniaspora guilliermondii]|uniref:Uncharacterized protein n=1 Tax=Hanseniaspora guilliermondii TaxID=56406 RepID=A0A1L0AU40_9ASCO|nr:uncharacterized protein HGUI_00274 [Hanseniaspora guilliermondii]
MIDNSSTTRGENMDIDDYDDYDAMHDQYAIDNYSIIGNNISKLKRFLSWFGFSNNDVYDIGDWSMNDNVELYNLDGNGGNEGEDVVRIMKREKSKKVRKTLMKVLGLIVVCGLFIYIVVNLIIVNKEYVEIKEAHKSMTSSIPMSTSNIVADNIYKKPTSTAYTVEKTSITFSKTTSHNVEKTSTTKATSHKKEKTSTISKTKTKSSIKSKHITTTKGAGLGPLIEDLWEDAKEIGEELVDEIHDIVDDFNHKIQDH